MPETTLYEYEEWEDEEYRYFNEYEHCDTYWSDEENYVHVLECPICGLAVEPYQSTDILTGAVTKNGI